MKNLHILVVISCPRTGDQSISSGNVSTTCCLVNLRLINAKVVN